MGASWGPLGSSWKPLGASWEGQAGIVSILRVSWGAWGPSWGSLGVSWGPLGSLLGPLGGVLGASWGLLAAKTRQERGGSEFLGALGAILASILGGFWVPFRTIFLSFFDLALTCQNLPSSLKTTIFVVPEGFTRPDKTRTLEAFGCLVRPRQAFQVRSRLGGPSGRPGQARGTISPGSTVCPA